MRGSDNLDKLKELLIDNLWIELSSENIKTLTDETEGKTEVRNELGKFRLMQVSKLFSLATHNFLIHFLNSFFLLIVLHNIGSQI